MLYHPNDNDLYSLEVERRNREREKEKNVLPQLFRR